jgi:hypothetical protein
LRISHGLNRMVLRISSLQTLCLSWRIREFDPARCALSWERSEWMLTGVLVSSSTPH